jgi:GxxExxY protein
MRKRSRWNGNCGGVRFTRQAPYSLVYKGVPVGSGRLDFLVDGCLVVELKAVDLIGEIHMAQCIAYLRATGHRLALIINFNVPRLVDGVRRVVL